MANRAKRARSRKRRLSASDRAAAELAVVDATPEQARRADASATSGWRLKVAALKQRRIALEERRRERSSARTPRASARRASVDGRSAISPTYGERPKSAWHPLPLSELLIAAGAVGVIVAFRRGLSHSGDALLAGIVAVALGTFEVTLREHKSGFRSHTTMLAFLPVLIFHSAVVLGVSLVTRFPPTANVGLFAIDIALFVFLFKVFRGAFLDARTKLTSRR